jgi:hypothetical protein
MRLEMKKQPSLSPEERLAESRSEIVNYLQNDNHLLQIFKPVIASYVDSNPMKTLLVSAGIGAAIVILKPWRLITLGSVLAVLKSRR